MQWGEYSLNMKGGIYYFLTSISCSRNRSAFPSFFISPSQDFSISIWDISSLNIYIFILIPCNQFSSSCCSFSASSLRTRALDQKIDTVVISWNCGEAKWQKCQAGEFFLALPPPPLCQLCQTLSHISCSWTFLAIYIHLSVHHLGHQDNHWYCYSVLKLNEW